MKFLLILNLNVSYFFFHIFDFHNLKIVNNICFFIFECSLIFLSKGFYTRVEQNNGNFKQIYFIMVFWLQSFREIRVWAARFLQFWGNCVFEMVIKLCRNFRSCILVILPNNLLKSLRVPTRLPSLSSRVLVQWRGFSFFLKCCHYFREGTSCYTKQFCGFCNTSACHTSTNNLTSFNVW